MLRNDTVLQRPGASCGVPHSDATATVTCMQDHVRDSLMLGRAPVCPAVRIKDSKQLGSRGPGMKVVSHNGSFPAAVGQWQDGRREDFRSQFPTAAPGVLMQSQRPHNQQINPNYCHILSPKSLKEG